MPARHTGQARGREHSRYHAHANEVTATACRVGRERNAVSVGRRAAAFLERPGKIMLAPGFARPAVPAITARPTGSKRTLCEFVPGCDERVRNAGAPLTAAVSEFCDVLVGTLTHGRS